MSNLKKNQNSGLPKRFKLKMANFEALKSHSPGKISVTVELSNCENAKNILW